MTTTHGALVAKAIVREHPNADRLKLAQVGGFQVVVGEDTNDGDIVLFFSSELQLSEEYATANDCVGYTDPVTGEKRGGYFGRNRKVRPQKFRGERSDGYIAPLSSLNFTYHTDGPSDSKWDLKVGDIFDTFNGVPICNKFVSKATKQFQGMAKQRKPHPDFPKHYDTEQLGYYYQDIPDGALITITAKVHGTSQRTGMVPELVEIPRTRLQRLFRRPTKTREEWITLNGTRNVVLDGVDTRTGFYSDESFRERASKQLEGKLHRGEIVYYEVVGWTGPDSPIMPPYDLTGSKDFKKLGKGHFTYGTMPGTCDIFVYRITQMYEDNLGHRHHRDLPWWDVNRRCHEMGVNVVPTLRQFTSNHGPEEVLAVANLLLEDPWDVIDPTHIKEGVVVRVDTPSRTYALKSKTIGFKIAEGLVKEQEDVVDMEEAS